MQSLRSKKVGYMICDQIYNENIIVNVCESMLNGNRKCMIYFGTYVALEQPEQESSLQKQSK